MGILEDSYLTIIGDARKFVSAVIVTAFDALEEYARTHGIKYSSREDLVKNPAIFEFYQKRIAENSKDLAGHEQIKKFILLSSSFTQEAGEMTPTMKLKRKVIIEKYKDIIDDMYRDR